jgi:putative polyhydroxyalkanoate system protein
VFLSLTHTMTHIHICKKHGLDHARARATAEQLATALASEYHADYQWQDDELKFRSPGIEGQLHVGKDEVEIKVRLGMMLRPLRGKIESGIRARLDAILS